MAAKTSSKLFYLCFYVLACALPCNCYCNITNKNGGNIQGMFVFGSSLVDSGNNNFLENSMAKANYQPYGIDFPLGPSGRFTNGKNVIDILGDKLNLPSYIPTFSDPSTTGSRIVHGVNYASGGSGILDETGVVAGSVTSLSQQIRNFEKVTLKDLEVMVRCSSSESLPNYLIVVGSGGNDYSLNYFINNNNVSIDIFTANLITALSLQLKKLYGLGGRKFVLMSINPLGCSPVIKANSPMLIGCNQNLNSAAHLFNRHLKSLVHVLQPQMPGSSLVYVNSYKIISDIIKNHLSKGFIDASNACCEVATRNEGGNGILCKIDGQVCANRSNHVFFDGLHPTEAVNVLIATKAFASHLKTEVFPLNVQQLSQFILQ